MRNQRRRILLAEEAQQGDENAPEVVRFAQNRTEASDSPAYASQARAQCERRIIELIPTRRLALGGVFVLAFTLVGLCEALGYWAPTLAEASGIETLSELATRQPRSMSGWASSLVLTMAGLTSAVIYSLRRHRVDDYHGRFRVWRWVAVVCLVAGALETTDLGAVARGAFQLACAPVSLDARIAWTITTLCVYALAWVRLLFEIRRSHAALVAMALVACTQLIAVLLGRGWLAVGDEGLRVPLAQALWHVGYVWLFLAITCYARQVSMDVTGGAVQAKPKRTKVAKQEPRNKVESKPPLQLRTDLDPVERKATPIETDDQDEDVVRLETATRPANRIARPGEQQPHMTSKAERRRLRREARMAG
jgi:hypothetical protein